MWINSLTLWIDLFLEGVDGVFQVVVGLKFLLDLLYPVHNCGVVAVA